MAEIVLHPGFENNTLVHDIALVKLARGARRRSLRESRMFFLLESELAVCVIWYHPQKVRQVKKFISVHS